MTRRALLAAGLFAIASALALAAPENPPPLEAFKAPLAAKAPLIAMTRVATRVIAVGDYGVIVLSDDAGKTWRQASSVATRNVLTAVTMIDARQGYAVGHGGTVLRTVDGGETWTRAYAAGPDVSLLAVWFENPRHGIAAGAFGFAIATEDGGQSWTRVAIGSGDDRDRHLNGIFALSDHSAVFIAAEAGTLFRSLDRGRTWSVLRLPYNGSMWGGIGLRNGVALVYGMRGHVLRSLDQGRSWAELPSGTQHSFTSGIELDDATVVLAGLGGALARTSADGQHLETTIRPDRRTYTALTAGAPGEIVVASMNGAASQPLP